MTAREEKLRNAVLEFSRIGFPAALGALERRESILFGEISKSVTSQDAVAIRAMPIQVIGSAPARQVELAIVLVDGEDALKRYVYIGECGESEAPPEVTTSKLNWK
jgi:hypothetical protein